MVRRQFNLWKNALFVIFLLFSIPLSLTAQHSHPSSETTLAATVRNSSSQPGDILFSQRFTGTRKILFLLIKYPGDAAGIISNSQAQSHKNLVIANLERNAYDSLSVTIDITPVLEMPNPDTTLIYNTIKRELEEINNEKTKGYMLRSKSQHLEANEHNSKYFMIFDQGFRNYPERCCDRSDFGDVSC